MTSQQRHSDLAIFVKSAEAQHAQAAAQQARAQHEQTAAVIAHLGKLEHCKLNTFTLTADCLHVHSASQLIAASWPNLTKLDFSGTILGAKAAAKLIKDAWPQLKSLCLSSCNLDTESMAQLATGAWPGLTQLNLSQNPGLIFAASQIATLADWPSLLDLDVSGIKIHQQTAVHVMRNYHATLQPLKLGHAESSHGDGVARLSDVPWPCLAPLELCSKKLAAADAATLAKVDMPQLTHLCLCGCNLKDAAVQKLVQGRWLKLQHLDLSNNQLSDYAMGRLAKGEWPVLKALLIEGNSVTALGFAELIDANWPKLTDLSLDMQCVQSVM